MLIKNCQNLIFSLKIVIYIEQIWFSEIGTHEKCIAPAESGKAVADLNAKEHFMKGVFAVSSYRDN